jgi:plastocyanin
MSRPIPALLAALACVAALATAALAPVASGASTGQTVRVVENSYSIRLSAKPRPGIVRFTVSNVSDDAHDFWLRGGGKTWKTRIVRESGVASLTATLRKGVRYTYWCSVGGHRTKGMSGSFVAR